MLPANGIPSSTINGSLLAVRERVPRIRIMIELGEGFLIPNLIRWPFEKVTFINQKSVLYRINGQLPQLPENISERAAAVSESSYDFLQELKNFLAQ